VLPLPAPACGHGGGQLHRSGGRRSETRQSGLYLQLLPLGGVIGGGITRPRSSMRSPRLLYRKPHSSLNEPSAAVVSAWEGGFCIVSAGYWPDVWAATAPATPTADSARTDIAFMRSLPLNHRINALGATPLPGLATDSTPGGRPGDRARLLRTRGRHRSTWRMLLVWYGRPTG